MSYHRRLENSVNKLSEDVLSLENKIVCLEKIVIEKFDAIKELLLDEPRANSAAEAVDVTNVTPTVISTRRRSVHPLVKSRASSMTETVDDTPAVTGARRRSESAALCESAPKRANSTLKVTTNCSIAAYTSSTNSSPAAEATVDSQDKGSTVVEKLIRKKEKAQKGSNKRALAKAHNDLANFYKKHNRYNEALYEYTLEATIWKDLGLQSKWGICNSNIGEIYMEMDDFKKALEYEDQHLDVAKKLNKLEEEVRGMNSRGIILRRQGLSMDSAAEAKVSWNAALEAFIEGLRLNERRRGITSKLDKMEMKAVLCYNIATVQENLGFFDKSLNYRQEAISIREEHKLCEYKYLHQCYTRESLVYCDNKHYDKALDSINKALEVAGRLEDKVQSATKVYEQTQIYKTPTLYEVPLVAEYFAV